jgi:hypothetical protein
MTISVYIKSDVTDTDKGFIIGRDPEGNDQRGMRYDKQGASSNRLRKVIKYGVRSGGASEEDESSYNAQTTDWQHVVMTWKSGVGLNLYLNGVLDQPGWDDGPEGGVTEGYTKLIVGKSGKDSGDNSWDGLVDEVKIYNYELSYEEVRGLAGKGDLDIPPVYGPMIAGYDFESGDATDSSDNNFHGTLLGDASVVAGELVLDGDGDCVDLGTDNRFNLGTGPFSISLWFKMNSWKDNWGNVMISKRGENGRGWQIRRRGSSHHLTFTTRGPGDDDPEGTIEPTLGEWYHLAAMYDGSQKWVYLNTQLDRHTGGINNLTMSGHNVYIGCRANRENTGRERYFDGTIDDVMVYNHVFTPGELRYLAGLGDLVTLDRYEPLIAHYTFDSNDGADSSGNELHGTLVDNAKIVYDADMDSLVLDVDATGNTHMNCGNSDLFDELDDQITVATWIKIRDFGGWWTKLVTNGANNSWRFERVAGDPYVSMCFDGTSNGRVLGDMNVDDGQWHHICAVLNSPSGYSALFVDGLIDAWNTGVSGTCNTNDNEIRVGDHQNWHDRTNGWFDDVRIYNSALTLGQVRTLADYTPTNAITNTWAGRGAATPVLEYIAPAHGGSQSMKIDYTGDGGVVRLDPFGDGAHPHGHNGDWTLGNAKVWTMYFRGDPGNAPGQMFAQLTTAASSSNIQRVIYDGNPLDLMNPNWQEWNIPLHELGTGAPAEPIGEEGIPLTKIKELGVGVIGGGSGELYFDDMRLYPTRCVPKYGPATDITGDCVVNESDLYRLLGSWLALSDPSTNGVWYEYYEDYFDGLNDFDARALTPKKSGVVANFDIGVRDRGDGFGFRFTAMVDAPVEGYYTFYTSSDDGSKLYIDGAQVVDNDGFHGMQWRQGTRYLTAGKHSIMVTMFEWGGGEGLEVQVEGPGIPRIPIPNEVLYLPLVAADVNGDGIVNFKDYAIMLYEEWLVEILYP